MSRQVGECSSTYERFAHKYVVVAATHNPALTGTQIVGKLQFLLLAARYGPGSDDTDDSDCPFRVGAFNVEFGDTTFQDGSYFNSLRVTDDPAAVTAIAKLYGLTTKKPYVGAAVWTVFEDAYRTAAAEAAESYKQGFSPTHPMHSIDVDELVSAYEDHLEDLRKTIKHGTANSDEDDQKNEFVVNADKYAVFALHDGVFKSPDADIRIRAGIQIVTRDSLARMRELCTSATSWPLYIQMDGKTGCTTSTVYFSSAVSTEDTRYVAAIARVYGLMPMSSFFGNHVFDDLCYYYGLYTRGIKEAALDDDKDTGKSDAAPSKPLKRRKC